jgi:glycosyltransferase involved in cell wall biosynthesis
MSRRPTIPRVMMLVNGAPGSAMAVRAESLAERLPAALRPALAYRRGRRLRAAGRLAMSLAARRPRAVYVVDLAFAGVAAALGYRLLTGATVVIDTGDDVAAIARALGRGRSGQWLSEQLERTALRHADAVVVRGSGHRPVVCAHGARRVLLLPDGVATEQFAAARQPGEEADPETPAGAIRRRHGLDGHLVVGMLGSMIWNERNAACYGAEVVEAIALLRDRPVKALLIGDGDGAERLRQRVRELGIEDRVVFAGRQPYDRLPDYLAAIDVAVSTQSNDAVGRVRTTGKLPLYLAAGRFVLASRVGEAARVLPPEMLVDYHGAHDAAYPARLAARVASLLDDPSPLALAADGPRIARETFDYDVLAARLASLLEDLISAQALPPVVRSPSMALGAPQPAQP